VADGLGAFRPDARAFLPIPGRSTPQGVTNYHGAAGQGHNRGVEATAPTTASSVNKFPELAVISWKDGNWVVQTVPFYGFRFPLLCQSRMSRHGRVRTTACSYPAAITRRASENERREPALSMGDPSIMRPMKACSSIIRACIGASHFPEAGAQASPAISSKSPDALGVNGRSVLLPPAATRQLGRTRKGSPGESGLRNGKQSRAA